MTISLIAALAAAALAPAAHAADLPGTLVYARELPSGFQLFTSHSDGTHETQITHLKGQPQHPDWSPDGKRIVFEYNYPNDKGCSIAFVDADGGNFKNLGRAPETCDFQPSFRPDGKRIVYTHYDDHANTETLTVAKLDGSDKHELKTRLRLGSVDANYSPNGRTITFVNIKKDEELQALFSIRADGSHLRRLTPYKWEIAVKHGWSPNGKRILVTRQRDVSGRPALALLLRPDGSVVRRLARNAYVGGFSPNGKRVVMRIERKGGTEGRLVTMDPRGGHRRAINAWSEFRPRFIDWGLS